MPCIKFLHFIILFLLPVTLSGKEHTPKLLLVSFDGFRWDYLSHTNNTPNFDRLINSGVKAKWIKDTFTSLTFPNHYTIVTGLYEDSHGIVGNTFYDPVFDEVFHSHNKTNVKDGKFWGGEPIWVTNQLHGGRSGVYFWVGSEAKIKNKRPTYYYNYTEHNATIELWKNHTDTVIQWMTNPDMVVDLALLYFKEPDHTGHIFGPDSPEVVAMIEQCDTITGYIMDKLEKHGLKEKVNIIITSDHGMTSMNTSRAVFLDEHINSSETNHDLNYVVGTSVWPKKEFAADLYKKLSNMSDHISTYWKKDIPPEYHYSKNRRIPPILLSAELGWAINVDKKHQDKLLGRHGFNNSQMDMHPFFVAAGPVFKKHYVSEPFENVHIYELMCYILGVPPAVNNGSLDAVKHLLLDFDEQEEQTKDMLAKWMGMSAGIVIAFGLLIYLGKQFFRTRISNRRIFHDNEKYDELDDHELLLDRV